MTNIPTDLLRTLIAVVELQSFTKAAAGLGITQPAVSAQIKRLQFLLGNELFDRSAHGIGLTPHGEAVVGYARRMLSINDQIMRLRTEPEPELVVRIGTSSDYVASKLPVILAQFRGRWPDVRFTVRTDYFEPMVRALRSGSLDIFIGLSVQPAPDALHLNEQQVVWARGSGYRLDLARPVPLVTYGDQSVYHRIAVTALRAAALEWEDVFTGPSMASLDGAVAAGLGVMPVTRSRAIETGVAIWDNTPLPPLPNLFSAIFVREGGAHLAYGELAASFVEAFHIQNAKAPSLSPSAA